MAISPLPGGRLPHGWNPISSYGSTNVSAGSGPLSGAGDNLMSVGLPVLSDLSPAATAASSSGAPRSSDRRFDSMSPITRLPVPARINDIRKRQPDLR